MPETAERDKVVVVPVQLSPRAASLIDGLKAKFGLMQKTAVGMGIEFLCSLPEGVLREVFRQGGDPVAELVRWKEAQDAGGGDTIEQAAASIRKQLGRLERMARSYRQELNDLHAGEGPKKKGSGKAGG